MDTEMDCNENVFKHCTKCHIFRKTIKDWMKHLVEFHPIPKKWMSEYMDIKCSTPYTIVTESRKKRRKNTIPRPLNSFMIFSRHLRRVVLLFFTDASNSEISKLLGKFWSSLPTDTKSLYDSEAKRLAILHSKEFPDYKYKPQKKKKIAEMYMNNNNFNSSDETWKMNQKEIMNNVTDFDEKKNSILTHVPSFRLNGTSDSSINKRTKITISNFSIEDFNDTESSVSSSRLPNKVENFQSISPMSDQSFQSIFERNISPLASRSVEQSNVAASLRANTKINNERKSSPIFYYFKELNNSFCITAEKSQPHELPLPFTRPLSIITTDSTDKRAIYIPARDNTKLKRDSDYNRGTSNSKSKFERKEIRFVDVQRKCGEIKQENINCELAVNVPLKSEPMLSIQSDPFINDEFSESDNFANESFPMNSDYASHGPSWLFQSPNYKLSALSSNSSDNNCREIYSSPSPFLLSETDQNFVPIHRLPAIGSWLKPNYSEHSI